jgi:uncharacterized Tic20 family protein
MEPTTKNRIFAIVDIAAKVLGIFFIFGAIYRLICLISPIDFEMYLSFVIPVITSVITYYVARFMYTTSFKREDGNETHYMIVKHSFKDEYDSLKECEKNIVKYVISIALYIVYIIATIVFITRLIQFVIPITYAETVFISILLIIGNTILSKNIFYETFADIITNLFAKKK